MTKRAIVFHEKNGRRHAHIVWSRIDVGTMKAINLPFYHNRLKEISKDLFLDHGWRLPEGFKDKQNRNPTNFTLAEWQQAKRQGKDARAIKRVFQEAWSISDTKAAFAHALEEKGYVLARGDRGRFVAVDAHGEVYAVPKWTGLKAKQVREKLGDAKQLQSVDEAKDQIARKMVPVLLQWQETLAVKQKELSSRQEQERQTLIEEQRSQRHLQNRKLEERHIRETKQRLDRFREGLQGLWDRVRGAHREIRQRNEEEAWLAHQRDQEARDDLIFRHLEERNALKRQHDTERSKLINQAKDLAISRDHFREMRQGKDGVVRDGPAMDR